MPGAGTDAGQPFGRGRQSWGSPGCPADTAAYIRREARALLALSSPAYPLDSQSAHTAVGGGLRRACYPDGLSRQGATSLTGFYAGRERQLQTIRVPTIVIHGSADPLVSPDGGRDVASNVPKARFVLIQGMGHGPHATPGSHYPSGRADSAQRCQAPLIALDKR